MKRKASPMVEEINIKFSRIEESNSISYTKESTNDYEYFANDSRLPRDAYCYSELHYAAVRGDAVECQRLIEVYPEAITDATYHGYLPVDLAAKNGNFEACVLLVANMTIKDIYAVRPYGHTTLSLIAKKDVVTAHHLKVFKALIDNVPENMHTLVNNTELLHIAILKGHVELCEIALKKNPNSLSDVGVHGYNAFYLAAQAGFKEIIEKLIDNACVKDVKNALLAEKELNNSQNDNTHTYLDHSGTNIILKLVGRKAIEYIAGRKYEAEYRKSFDANFHYHLKWLKLYHAIHNQDSHKDHLINNWQTYLELLNSVKNYYVENFFKIKGVCKTITKDHLFAVLNDGFVKSTITILVEQSFLDPCKVTSSLEDVLPTNCIGEDSDLG